MNSLEIADKKAQLIKRNLDLLALAKQEVRELTEEEDQEFKENEEEIQNLDEEQKELDAELEKEEEKEEKSNTNISGLKTMEKKNFSIIEEINRSMETHQPIILNRAVLSVANEGEDIVPTDVWDVWEDKRPNRVLADSGCTIRTGLVGDVLIPLYSRGNVSFKGETATADEGNGSFTSVSLQPKRVCGKFPISLQMLAQSANSNFEQVVRNGISAAVWDKIESVVLGAGAASATIPAGLFNGLTPTTVATYADVTALEAELEEDNYTNYSFIVSPKAKAALRAMEVNDHRMVMEGNEVDGYKAMLTSNVAAGKFLVADWSNVVIGLWDEIRIDVVADSSTLADGQIMIIVNAFCDAKLARANALVAAEIDE